MGRLHLPARAGHAAHSNSRRAVSSSADRTYLLQQAGPCGRTAWTVGRIDRGLSARRIHVEPADREDSMSNGAANGALHWVMRQASKTGMGPQARRALNALRAWRLAQSAPRP